ncbi:flavin reductase [Micromonospora sp. NBC_01796]|uniref:flavin reductase n=1 Tax=Micromonospora sp. NBC_01796 TaxID=2975987 RepID=UPI002DD7A871|nr:flavin reductase [Micromonospora sp. NBC_01796]WSA86796.1 flavin reductase [Micromonospora sp. NBC_01796]
MADAVIHAPTRPTWLCRACGSPWPCLTRKRQLKVLFQCDAVRMRRHLVRYLADASADLGESSTRQLTERLLGWCDRPLPRPP